MAMNPTCRVRNAGLEAASRSLHELCVQYASEMHHFQIVFACEACKNRAIILGHDEVGRVLGSPVTVPRQ